MKLEIDIPSIIYQDAKENRGYISVNKMEIAWKAIADGKPIKQESILDKIDEIITDALDKSTDQKESQTLRWVLDKISEVT